MNATPGDDGLLSAVREAVDLVELARDYTELEQRGTRYKGLCPFHKEKTPSFSIDRDRGLYYCFGCGAGGDAIKFHMQLTGDDFRMALEALARRFGIPIPQGGGFSPEVATQLRVLERAEEFFVRRLESSPGPQRYLEEREVPEATWRDLRIGYAPDAWQELLEALGGDFSREVLERAGLTARSERSGRAYDRFRNRLMFPIRATSGRLVGFGGRTLGDDRAKYLNTAETESFRKGTLLYNLHRARAKIREAGRVLLVEGYFDVLGAMLSGIDWSVASMGTALTEQQAKLLARYADVVIIGYDGDRAGEEASRKALPMLLRQGVSVRRARFPAGQDPDSLRLEEGAGAVAALIEEAPDAIDVELDRLGSEILSDPRLRSEAAATLRQLLETIPDSVLRYSYGERAARHLALPVEVFWRSRGSAALRDPRSSRARRARTGAGEEPEPAEMSPEHALPRASMEERVLTLLLWFGVDDLAAKTRTQGSASNALSVSDAGDADEVPSPELFTDADCREIYRALVASGFELASEPSDHEPLLEISQLRQVLPPAGSAQARLARMLASEPSAPAPGELARLVRTLSRKGAQKRQRALQAEISAAQARGDEERVQEILVELEHLRRQRHERA